MILKHKLLLLLIAFGSFSCEDILEEDISGDIPVIVYPVNNEEIYSNVVNFQWHEMQGATSYRIQVIADNQSVVLDELVSGTSHTAPITPGQYQWRLRGENFAYNSAFSMNGSFSIFETDDISNQQVILSNPSDHFYTNNTDLILNWDGVSNAETYTYQLIYVSDGSTLVDEQSELTETSIQLNSTLLSGDAEYLWKVKGVNQTGETPYAQRTFYLDKTAPLQPVNQLPIDNSAQAINQAITFSWTMGPDIGVIQSDISYVVEFSNNENFSTIFLSVNASTTSTTQTFTTSDNFYWRVKAKDSANNIGLPSNVSNFVIN